MTMEADEMRNEECTMQDTHSDPPVSRQKLKGSTGFTLLEIIVVVFILSLLAAIVAPKIVGRTDDARIAEAKVQIRNLETALKLFKMDSGFYPDTQQGLQSLVEKPSGGRLPQNYREGGYLEQKKIPLDPWGNPYIYVSPGLNGDYDLLSYGADGKEGGQGKDADITSWDMK
jgi:general secretion pathway protein G